jgi:hypothetical protein
MTDKSNVGVGSQEFRLIALEARRIGTQDKFIDFAMMWASDADRYINHLISLLDQQGIKCICTGLRLDPFCVVHTIPEIDLLQ